MITRGQDKAKPSSAPKGPSENLPYAIELWSEDGSEMERILARASSVSLARAIFDAATKENASRHICLRHGSRLLADSAKRS
jgi:hypothetical protein